MLIRETNVISCLHWWSVERQSDQYGRITASEEIQTGMHQAETILISITFPALDYLYVVTRNIPSPWTGSRGMGVKSGGTYGLYMSINLSPEHYLLLRTVLSLAGGDVYLSSKALLDIGNLMELESPIKQLSENAGQFRDIRNFFTHLDKVLSEPDKHGVTGATHTNCGIVYTDTARGCRHLVLAGDKIHFTYRRNKWDVNIAKEVDIGKSAFNGIFESARLIYAELTSHKIHAQTCHHTPANDLYPL